MKTPRSPSLPVSNSYQLGDAIHDMMHLWRLLDVAVETAVNVPRSDGAAEDLARLDSCVWIARDVAEKLRRQLETIELNDVERPSAPMARTIQSTELTAEEGRSLAAAFETISDVAYGLACQPRFKAAAGGQNIAGEILTSLADEIALQHDKVVDGLPLSMPMGAQNPRAKADAAAV